MTDHISPEAIQAVWDAKELLINAAKGYLAAEDLLAAIERESWAGHSPEWRSERERRKFDAGRQVDYWRERMIEAIHEAEKH